jgi:O-antigen/teichoic acid export membrane protein
VLKKLLDLLSDSATYGVSSILSQLIGFLLLPLYTQYLSPVDYGVMAMLSILSTVFGPLANLGMTSAIFRRFNLCDDEDERREVLSTGLFSVVGSSLLLLGLGQLVALPLTTWLVEDASLVHLVRLTLLSATLSTVGAVPQVTLRADRRVKAAAGLNVANVAISMSLTIWFVVGLGMGLLGVVLGQLIASLVVMLLQFLVTSRSFRLAASRASWRYMLSYGLPLMPHKLQAIVLSTFGQYMVKEMLGLEQAGLFNIAVKIALPVKFVIGAVQQAWVPFKFQIHAQDDDPAAFFRSAVTYYLAAISYLWVGVALWGPEVLRLMTTPSFHGAAGLIPFVALIPVSNGLYFMLGTGFELSDNTKPMPLVSLGGLAAVVVGALILVPPLGATGAAVATVLGWLMMTTLIYALSQRRFTVKYDWHVLGLFTLLSVGAVTAAVLGQGLPAAVRLALALVLSLIYPVAVLLVMLRSRTEGNRVRLLLQKLHPFGKGI